VRGEQVEASASIDGFRVWCRVPARHAAATVRGDPFLALTLLPAMLQSRSIVVDSAAPVSPTLISGIDRIQDVFSCWYGALAKVAIRAEVAPAARPTKGVASFFSGGVDGLYTLWKHPREISHLVFVHGLDIELDDRERGREVLAENSRFARRVDKTLVPIETNVRSFVRSQGLTWDVAHGAALAAFAHLLDFSTMFVAASHTYAELLPWGSHPLTDPLWSSEAVALVHDGAEASRSDKLRALASWPEALEILRVCWQPGAYNCGRCEKCLRTMVTLRLLGLHAPRVPPLECAEAVSAVEIASESQATFWLDNLRVAEGVGDRAVAEAVRVQIDRYRSRVTE
jgi:hypothetical protein